MANSSEFTHNGSHGKNFVLILRSLLNLVAFTALWFGLLFWFGDCSFLHIPEWVPIVCTCGGGAATVALLFFNLFIPFARRKK